MNKKISDPSVFLLLGFGFGLVVLGVQQLMPTNPNLIGAATYATLVAAIAEFGGGLGRSPGGTRIWAPSVPPSARG